jgi:hypothetical protein
MQGQNQPLSSPYSHTWPYLAWVFQEIETLWTFLYPNFIRIRIPTHFPRPPPHPTPTSSYFSSIFPTFWDQLDQPHLWVLMLAGLPQSFNQDWEAVSIALSLQPPVLYKPHCETGLWSHSLPEFWCISAWHCSLSLKSSSRATTSNLKCGPKYSAWQLSDIGAYVPPYELTREQPDMRESPEPQKISRTCRVLLFIDKSLYL